MPVAGWDLGMKILSVQIQPDLQPNVDFDAKVLELQGLAQGASFVEKVSVESGLKGGRFVNVNFHTSDVTRLWTLIRSSLGLRSRNAAPLSRAIIVVSEGEDGWNDYRLLHHFDDGARIDKLGEEVDAE